MEWNKKFICCRPFLEHKCSLNLLKVSSGMLNKLPAAIRNSCTDTTRLRICSSCYLRLNKEKTSNVALRSNVTPTRTEPGPSMQKQFSSSESSSISNVEAVSSDEELIPTNEIIMQGINTLLPCIGHTPIYQSRIEGREGHHKKKLTDLSEYIEKNILETEITPLDKIESVSQKAKYYDEMMLQLKSKFAELNNNAEKIQLLTVLPKSFSIPKIQKEFDTTYHTARTSKLLQQRNGVLSKPGLKVSHKISEEARKTVHEFYLDDDISRIMPGKNDCMSVRDGNEKITIQKRLMLSTLKECYILFKEKYGNDSELKIGFSKFAELRPVYCVQPGASGTHTVCLCVIHQNVKLMMFAMKISELSEGKLANYKDCISYVLCENPQPSCYLKTCIKCRGLSALREHLSELFEQSSYGFGEITFKQWVSTDRCDLENFIKPLDDFLDYFTNKFEKLIPHHFISQQQSSFLKKTKESLGIKEMLVLADFAENYAFVMQNSVQGFHWNNNQATIHPFVAYYKDDNGLLQHYSFIVISECLLHDAVAVYLFMGKLILFLKSKMSVNKIFYMTDGAPAQYKNRKNFANILHHREDFGLDCEWHFHATSHGKGPCDGLGGTIKRQAARASLTNDLGSHIRTPRELYEWATKQHTAMEFSFATTAEYEQKKLELEERFTNAKAVKGSQGFHAFIPLVDRKMKCRIYSNSQEYQTFQL